MTDDFDPQAFAERWAAAWNALDVEQVLAHFAEDCSFISPLAATLTGSATLQGRAQLAAYWRTALQHVRSLHFELDRLAWDAERRTLVVVYVARTNGQAKRAAEAWTFDASGQVQHGEALYGAALT